MPDPIKISPAEAQVMEVLWRGSPLASHQILSALIPHPDWSEGTVRTLLQRLVKKGAVSTQGEARAYLYSPAVTREHYVTTEGQGVLDRLFGGSLEAMVLHFAKRGDMSPQRLAKLKAAIEELEDDA